MADTDIRRIVERIQTLPTLPTVVMQLIKLVNDPGSTANDVQAILGRDQSLTVKVMKLVNSSFYGYAGKIKTLQQAVVILGFGAIKSLSLSATVFSAFSKQNREGFDRGAFWQHVIATGVAARLIASEVKGLQEDEVFIAGIIHDIGKVVLDEYAPDLFDKVLREVRTKHISIYDAEKAVLGASHAQVGRWLGTRWGLPPEMIDAIFYHHQPENAQKAPSLVAAVHLGDHLARFLKLGSGGDDLVPAIGPTALRQLGLTDSSLKKAMSLIPAEFAKADLFVQMAQG